MLTRVLALARGSFNPPIEPLQPIVKTSIPGPESLSLLNELESSTQDYRTVFPN